MALYSVHKYEIQEWRAWLESVASCKSYFREM